MIDARRMEVYSMIVSVDLNPISPIAPRVIDASSFHDLLQDRKIIFFGDGSAKCRTVINHINAHFIDGVYPQASKMGELVYLKLKSGEIEDLESFEPFYLKEFMIKTAKQH
jgi:tRNA threonylcarbamoyladenosine biosynthesis protein TsaB